MLFSNPSNNELYYHHPRDVYSDSGTLIDPRSNETSGQAEIISTGGPPINTQGHPPMWDMHDTGVPSRNHVLQVRSDPETPLHVHQRTKPTAAWPAMLKVPAVGKPRAQFMLHTPCHEYLLPKGTLINATVADIVVLLPQWFRNPGIAFRFLNNGITAATHFAILKEHRYLNCDTPEEAERARDHLSDTYRKVMRMFNPSWKKVKHQAPEGWDPTNLSIHDFVPEAAKQAEYMAPPSIPFKDLAIGLKKLPQGLDAGDLTRALNYALLNVKTGQYGHETELMFPDDIHFILEHIGAVEVTQSHIDRVLIARYAHLVRKADATRRKRVAGERLQQEQEAGEKAHQPMSLAQLHLLSYSQPALGQQIPHELPYGNMSMPPHMLQQLTPYVPDVAHQWIGRGNTRPQNISAFQPTQAEQPEYIIPNAAHIAYQSPHPDFPPAYSHPFQPTRSSSQEAAVAVASSLLSRGTQQATADFPTIPDICKWEGGGGEEQQMDALMAANQTPDLSSLLTLGVEAALHEPAGQGSISADEVAVEDVEDDEG
ncbi:hypothetical protein DDE82_004320 [Stemphylium lycopersici]|nr:hypothetical protein TW65_06476 [Stemphylium lycopersici]RAR04841.1 hypothetical protein DDE82_004320 [Stemphylium lycopersici]